MREGYNNYFGFKKETPEIENALGVILKRDEENTHKPKRLELAMSKYVTNKIHTLYGISFIEFINLTPAEIIMMIEHAPKIIKEDNKLLDTLKKEMGE